MANVQTMAAGVGKHIKHIIFGLKIITIMRFECFVLCPEVLPLLFNFAEFIRTLLRTHLFLLLLINAKNNLSLQNKINIRKNPLKFIVNRLGGTLVEKKTPCETRG
jgi:hypothetical protein